MRKFVLLVKYGTGKAAMLTDTPDDSIYGEKDESKSNKYRI